jgi:hypothetical protein
MVPSVWHEQLDKILLKVKKLPFLIVVSNKRKMIVTAAEGIERILVSFTIGTEIHYL